MGISKARMAELVNKYRALIAADTSNGTEAAVLTSFILYSYCLQAAKIRNDNPADLFRGQLEKTLKGVERYGFGIARKH